MAEKKFDYSAASEDARPSSQPENPHYSQKGSHRPRGEFWRAQQILENRLGIYCCRAELVPLPIPAQIASNRRRYMPRYGVQDGRR